jgi:hypothetical protein
LIAFANICKSECEKTAGPSGGFALQVGELAMGHRWAAARHTINSQLNGLAKRTHFLQNILSAGRRPDIRV